MRVLIVEDDENYRPELEEWLRVNFEEEGIELESATTVEEGRDKLFALHQRGKPLDALILDALLPARKGEHEEIDLSLVSVARDRFPDSLLIIYTAYEPDVSPLARETRGVDYVLDKNAPNAKDHLVQVLRDAPLLKRLRDVFGDRSYGRGTRSGAGSRHCVSWALNTLVSDILRVYPKLSRETRDKIRRYIPIEEDDQGNPIVKSHSGEEANQPVETE